MNKRYFISLLFVFIVLAGQAQNNLLSDPFFKMGVQENNTTQINKWIHFLTPTVVNGTMKRIKWNGYADSIFYCKAKYLTTSTINRGNCYFAQRVSGLSNKKYRISFWMNLGTKSSYLTAEVRYFNELLTNETSTLAKQFVIQSYSSSTANYQVPGNWVRESFDIDLTGVTNLKRLSTIRLTFYPNCSNSTTQSAECEYWIAEPKIYEITDETKEYLTDPGFDFWNVKIHPETEANWIVSAGQGACVKRCQGHLDSDYGYTVHTTVDDDGSYVETNAGKFKVPSSKILLRFYARSEEAGGIVRIGSKLLTTTKEVMLTDEWTRQEVELDYSSLGTNFPMEDNLQFKFIKANNYYLDECWIDTLNSSSTAIEYTNDQEFEVISNGTSLHVLGQDGQLQVFNIPGHCLYSGYHTSGGTKLDVNSPGIYFVRLETNQKVLLKKVMLR